MTGVDNPRALRWKTAVAGWRSRAILAEARVTGPPVTLVALVAYAALAASHALVLAGSARAIMAGAAGATSLALTGSYLLQRRGAFTGQWPLIAVIVLATANSALHMAVTGEAQQTTNFLIVLVATGFFVLDLPVFGALTALLVGSWLVVMPTEGGAYLHYGFAMATALVLALTTGEIRRRTIFRLTSKSNALKRSKAELETNFQIIQEQEEEALLMTRNISDLLVRLDSDGRVVFANEAAEKVLGVLPGQLRGSQLRGLVAPVSYDSYDSFLQAARAESTVEEVRCVTADGTRRWIELRGEPLSKGHILVVCRDIDSRRQTEAMKDSLIATAGHELRTPMTAIHGALALMQDADAETQNLLLDTALQSSERMIRLVNQTLDLERASRMEGLEFAQTRARTILEDAVEGVKNHPLAGNCQLLIEGTDAELEADRDKLIQVVINLLANAMRYAPADSTVHLGCEDAEARVEFWVRDEGPGVPAEARERIFKAFEQAESVAQRQDGTTGLGLTISKAIVEAQNGRIWLADTPRGAEFRFSIPKTQETVP